MACAEKIADVLRAEYWGLDLEDTSEGISVFAMRRDGSLYKLGHVAIDAVYQDPDGSMRAISEIKFSTHLKD